jgi:hypothetical protein
VGCEVMLTLRWLRTFCGHMLHVSSDPYVTLSTPKIKAGPEIVISMYESTWLYNPENQHRGP